MSNEERRAKFQLIRKPRRVLPQEVPRSGDGSICRMPRRCWLFWEPSRQILCPAIRSGFSLSGLRAEVRPSCYSLSGAYPTYT
jgi:hypothetical protein